MEKGYADSGRYHLLPGQVVQFGDEKLWELLPQEGSKAQIRLKSGARKGCRARFTVTSVRTIAVSKNEGLNAADIEGGEWLWRGPRRSMGWK